MRVCGRARGARPNLVATIPVLGWAELGWAGLGDQSKVSSQYCCERRRQYLVANLSARPLLFSIHRPPCAIFSFSSKFCFSPFFSVRIFSTLRQIFLIQWKANDMKPNPFRVWWNEETPRRNKRRWLWRQNNNNSDDVCEQRDIGNERRQDADRSSKLKGRDARTHGRSFKGSNGSNGKASGDGGGSSSCCGGRASALFRHSPTGKLTQPDSLHG